MSTTIPQLSETEFNEAAAALAYRVSTVSSSTQGSNKPTEQENGKKEETSEDSIGNSGPMTPMDVDNSTVSNSPSVSDGEEISNQ